jgi:hypothetical protein
MSEEEYVVEKLVGKRINKEGVLEYKVKWEGYSDQESTWEPLENLINVKNIIEEYEKSLSIKQNIKKKYLGMRSDQPKSCN